MINTRTQSYIIGLSVFIFLFMAPTVVFGQTDYTPLAPLPIPGGDDSISFTDYLGGVFTFLIGIAVALGVLMIALGGIRYMSTDAVSGKRDGLDMVNAAIGGLILIALSWLILRTINPGLLNFSLNVQPSPDGPTFTYSEDSEIERYFTTIDSIYANNVSVSQAAREIEAEAAKIEEEIAATDNVSEQLALNEVKERLELEAKLLRKFESFGAIWKKTVNDITNAYQDGANKTEVDSYHNTFVSFARSSLHNVQIEFNTLLKEYSQISKIAFSVTNLSEFVAFKIKEIEIYEDTYHKYRLICPRNTKPFYVDGKYVDISCKVNGEGVPEEPTIQSAYSIQDLLNIQP